MVENLPANAEDMRDAGSIPGSGRSLAGEHDNPLQYSCLENPMDRGAWQAMVHRVTKNQTRLKQLSSNSSSRYSIGVGFPGSSVVKNLPANAGDTGLISGLRRPSGAGNDNPLQYSCLGNKMDKGA